MCTSGLASFIQHNFLRFTHAVASINNSSFLCVPGWHALDVHTTICLSIHRHLGCVHFWALTKKGAMHICVQVFVWTYALISLGYMYIGVE